MVLFIVAECVSDDHYLSPMRIGPLGAILRERPDLQVRVVDSIRAAVTPYRTDAGVFFDSATWIITARKEA